MTLPGRQVSAPTAVHPARANHASRRRSAEPDTTSSRTRAARPHLGLRVRSALAWAAGGLVLSVGLSVVAYQLVRTQLVEDRQDRATAQAYVNARAVRNTLRTTDPDLSSVLGSLSTNSGSTALTWVDGRWFASAVGTQPGLLPGSIQELVTEGSAGSQIASLDGAPHVVVGVPITEAGARYYEVFSLEDVDAALGGLARGLALAAVVSTAGAAVAGWYVSRQVLRPVRTMAAAAQLITAGDLDARLDVFGDPELEPLQRSFNEMADEVQGRIERERRFTSDVSHELRSPLTGMLSSVQIARRRADDPVAVKQALADLEQRSDHFRTLVLDLLEISRMDAGVADVLPEPVDPEALVKAVLDATGHDAVPIRRIGTAPTTVVADKRRFGQIVQNLLENADRYAGGATEIVLDGDADHLVVLVDDAGPGVPEHERTHVFNRFARGAAGGTTTEGSGLGLALVAEHVRLHGGSVAIGTSPSGGARFAVTLPVGSEGPRP
jgi:signal transduction histidine kinase